MLFTRVFPNILLNLQRTSLFSSLQPALSSPVKPGGLFEQAVRTNIRVHFPRPSERKRIKRHGWKKRLSTEAGRRILMNAILRGKHVYSH